MKRWVQKYAALLVAALCMAAQAPALAQEAEEAQPRYVFNYGIEEFDARFQGIFDAMGNAYEMGEEPNIDGAYEYHLPADVYAKVLIYEGNIEYILLFLQADASENQPYLWQFGAIMAAAVGDMPANLWAEMLMQVSALTLDPQAAERAYCVAGSLMMLCESDPDEGLLYVLLEREENERNEPMDGSFQTGLVRSPAAQGL